MSRKTVRVIVADGDAHAGLRPANKLSDVPEINPISYERAVTIILEKEQIR